MSKIELTASAPDPTRAGTPAEYIEAVRTLKHVRGRSLRELQRRTGLPRSTIAHTLNPDRPQLPPLDRVTALVRALGVVEEEVKVWSDEWIRIQRDAVRGNRQGCPPPARQSPVEPVAGTEAPAAPATAVPAGSAGPEAGPARAGGAPGPSVRRRVRRTLTHALALTLGLLVGVGGTLALTGPRATLGYPTDPTGCPSGVAPASPGSHFPQGASVAPAPPGSAHPSWVARPAYDAQILGGTQVVLPVTSQVAAGDTLVLTVMLTSTCAGDVHATDSRGDTYRIVGDVTDASRHRTLVLAAFDVKPLDTGDQITLDYPHASKYHAAVDEFRGVHAIAGHVEGYGSFGGTAFTAGTRLLSCRPGDLLLGAVGTNTGTAPQFAEGWTTLPVLKLSSYRLTTAYRIAADDTPCAATGTTTAEWGAVLATFR